MYNLPQYWQVVSLALTSAANTATLLPKSCKPNLTRQISRSCENGLQEFSTTATELSGSVTRSSLRTSLDFQSHRKRSFKIETVKFRLSSLLKTSKENCNDASEDLFSDPILKHFIQMEKRRKLANTRERRLALIMCVLIGVFVLCYLPFWSIYICLSFFPTCTPPSPLAMSLVQWLALANSLLNPIVYTGFNADFRNGFWKTVTCKK